MSIRKAIPRDFSKVEPVLVEVEHHHVRLEPDVFQPITRYDKALYLDYLQNPDSCIWIAEEDERVMGVIIAKVHQRAQIPMYKANQFVVVEEICVSESFRGRGIGKQLMKTVEDWAGEQGVEQVQLSVWTKNIDAVNFYDALGYAPFLIRMRKNIGKE